MKPGSSVPKHRGEHLNAIKNVKNPSNIPNLNYETKPIKVIKKPQIIINNDKKNIDFDVNSDDDTPKIKNTSIHEESVKVSNSKIQNLTECSIPTVPTEISVSAFALAREDESIIAVPSLGDVIATDSSIIKGPIHSHVNLEYSLNSVINVEKANLKFKTSTAEYTIPTPTIQLNDELY
jgi:hypothetical protein